MTDSLHDDMARRWRLSDILRVIAEDPARDRISVGDLVTLLRGRALAALLLIFALPNALPAIPGTSSILGLPLLYLSSQLMLGRTPWLPKFISARSLSRADFAAMVDQAEPWLERAERMLRPRLTAFAQPTMHFVIGAVCLLLSVCLVLPIPLGNMLPGLAISLLALGLLERDGLWILIGFAVSVLAVFIIWGVVYTLMKSALFVLMNALA